jgi:hypothetical protein
MGSSAPPLTGLCVFRTVARDVRIDGRRGSRGRRSRAPLPATRKTALPSDVCAGKELKGRHGAGAFAFVLPLFCKVGEVVMDAE